MKPKQEDTNAIAEAKALLQKETEKRMKQCWEEVEHILNKYAFKIVVTNTIQLIENEQRN